VSEKLIVPSAGRINKAEGASVLIKIDLQPYIYEEEE
jgi:hypothetical protein